jgi:predicted NBD/HSP70 family sugar kinase
MAHGHPLTRHPSPIRQASLREHNLALVLREVATAGTRSTSTLTARHPFSRADIATETGLTRSTVSALVDDLIAGRLVVEVAPTPKVGAGRPSVGLALDPRGPAGLGLEINVDYLAACVIDLTGAVRHREVHHGDQRPRRPADVLADLAELAESALSGATAQNLHLAGAAMAVPGLVQTQMVRLAPNLGWRNVEMPAEIAGIPVRVDNEANLAAMGELFTNPHAGRNFIYVSGEIGIGAGVMVGGEILGGARGFSGEMGHVAVQPNGPACRCGAYGCLEQYAGQEAMLRASGLIPAGSTMPIGTTRHRDRAAVAVSGRNEQTVLPAPDIAAGARAGNRKVLGALDSAGTALGIVLASMVNLIDVDTVILGGIYARLEPWLHNHIARELAERVLAADWAPVAIRPSVLAEDAAVVGAAASVIRTVWDHPAAWIPGR